jgi:hypothetical protein
MRIQTLVVSALMAVAAVAHSTKYPMVNRNEACWTPEPAEIYSYHIHMIYWQNNNQSIAGAYRIRDAFKEAFKSVLGPDCHDLFHEEYNCMLDPDEGPAGPFLEADWSVFVLAH